MMCQSVPAPPGHRDELLSVARLALSVPGEFWECGVYRGCGAAHLAQCVTGHGRTLRLFDTFAGRPDKGPHDTGNSAETFEASSESDVRALCPQPFVRFHVGLIPETFRGLEHSAIAFAYIDLDLYQSTVDALRFIAPRLSPGGYVMVDDYLEPVWPGVRRAVEDVGCEVCRLIGKRAVIQSPQLSEMSS